MLEEFIFVLYLIEGYKRKAASVRSCLIEGREVL
jgi:hypothetical protein